jgi:hypothetical protein
MKALALILWVSLNGAPAERIDTGRTYTEEENLKCVADGLELSNRLLDEAMRHHDQVIVRFNCDTRPIPTEEATYYYRG